MSSVLAWLRDTWPSILTGFLVALGGFLSMGILGLAQYYLVSPALNLGFPPLEKWDQSVVWPLIIVAPILWSPTFLLAGTLNTRLKRAAWARGKRVLAYLAILWLGAAAAWWFLLITNESVWR